MLPKRPGLLFPKDPWESRAAFSATWELPHRLMVGDRSTANETISSEVLFHGGLPVNLPRSHPFQLNDRLAFQAFGKRLEAVREIAARFSCAINLQQNLIGVARDRGTGSRELVGPRSSARKLSTVDNEILLADRSALIEALENLQRTSGVAGLG